MKEKKEMNKEEFITKAMSISTKEEFESLYNEVTNTSRAQAMTKNGAAILKFLQGKPEDILSAKSIGEEMGISSRSISGTMRKLITDGYVSKEGSNPTVYKITDKGLNYTFDN